MASRRSKRRQPDPRQERLANLPLWLTVIVFTVLLFPSLLDATFYLTAQAINTVPRVIASLFPPPDGQIAPLFTREIQHWSGDINRWAETYDLDANLIATVMQIESCGHPTIASVAGAQGLFQVMPFHFEESENSLDPDTNALRSANFLNYCLKRSNGDAGLTLACYNGGPSVVDRAHASWPAETQRYYRWGTGIYADAVANSPSSQTLDQWLQAGGRTLCSMAAVELGLQ